MPTLRRQAEIVNALGLHLRAASQFARLARQFQAEVRVCLGGSQGDGKSLLDLATLAACCGAVLVLEASGPEAEAALAALAELVACGFHEPADCDINPARP
jgi:phosphotransferase system HPr (HPr) family protein